MTLSSAATAITTPFTLNVPAWTRTPGSKNGEASPVALNAASALTWVPKAPASMPAAARKPLLSFSSASAAPATFGAMTSLPLPTS